MSEPALSVLKFPVILSIIMNKGGVGKTTTCANIAAALSEKRPTGNTFRIGVIDLDPQTNLSCVLGLDELQEAHGDDLVTIAEFLDPENQDIPTEDFFYEVNRPFFDGRLSLLPGHIDLESLKDDLEYEMKSKSTVRGTQSQASFSSSYDVGVFEQKKAQLFMTYRERLRQDLAGKYDYIIIDTPPSRGFLTQFALGMSDYVLPVMIPGTKEFDGLIMMEQLIADCWASYNPKLSCAGVLINNLFEREVLSKDIREMAKARYQGKELMLKTEIPRSVRIAEAISNDRSVFESEHRDAEAYRNIYRKLLTELYSRALTNKVNTTVSPEFFYDLHYGTDSEHDEQEVGSEEQGLETVVKGVVNE